VFAEQTDNILFIWAVGIRVYFLYTYVHLGRVRRQRLLGAPPLLWRPCVGGQVFGDLVSFGAFRTFIWNLEPHVTTISGAKCFCFLFFLMPQKNF
jgi:hypothetical protein